MARSRTIPTTASKLQEELDHLTTRGKHVRSLVDGADSRRSARADDEIDVSVDDILDGTDGVIRCRVWGSDGEHEYDVTITPITKPWDRFDYRWSCTCPDAQKAHQHGRGPCKHVIAVAQVWLAEQARPMYRFLKSLLDAEQGKEPEPSPIPEPAPAPEPYTPPTVAELIEAEREAGPMDAGPDPDEWFDADGNFTGPGPQPGTWAHTARLLAGPNPTPEEAEFWDNWKDEMKERDL